MCTPSDLLTSRASKDGGWHRAPLQPVVIAIVQWMQITCLHALQNAFHCYMKSRLHSRFTALCKCAIDINPPLPRN
ncbi:hypothetical protein B0T12DRAFT_426899 [Alternaria alternata]|nr:hypothetical protein B0T12DRAFT_426899 [Alternaria alternata]